MSETSNQMSLEKSIEFAVNPEPRCACVVLVDCSGSMQGAPIQAVNEGLKRFADESKGNPLAAKRVEVAVVSFNSTVKVLQSFVTVDQFQAPIVEATGQTNMGSGIEKALDMLAIRKSEYDAGNVLRYRPWIIMITDGSPTDVIDRAIQRVHEAENNKGVAFFAVGVEGADMACLERIAHPERRPMKLQGLKFVELFVWLSKSLGKVGTSSLGQIVTLDPPTGFTV